MKLSTKSRYGARALLEIVAHEGERPIKRKQIVEKQNIPDSYLENILIALKSSGLIETVRGARGGYVLAREPASITLLDVVEALEGPVMMVDCEKNNQRCDKWDTCVTREIWREMEEAQKKVLGKYSLAGLNASSLEKSADQG